MLASGFVDDPPPAADGTVMSKANEIISPATALQYFLSSQLFIVDTLQYPPGHAVHYVSSFNAANHEMNPKCD